MMPRPYSMDAHSRAEDLASSVLSSSSPPDIASAICDIESFIRKHSADQSRAFFSIAFPAIICRLFGFDDSSSFHSRSPAAAAAPSTAWIEQADHDPDLAARLFALLSTKGPLLSAVFSADRLRLVKYVFPAERLPEWMRFALQSEEHFSILAELCPLFRGRVKEDSLQRILQLQLNAFEYFLFWFAYYPVCKANCDGSDDTLLQKSRRKSRLGNWTSSLPVLAKSGRRSGQKTEVSLYLRLLYEYVHIFVPKYGLVAYQPYRSSLLNYSSTCDSSAFEEAEFIVNTLIHFWLVDGDFSPFSLSVRQSSVISFPTRAALGDSPPTSGLGEVLKLFVKHLNSCLVDTAVGNNEKVSGLIDYGSRVHVLCLENSFGSWNSMIQRPLYRFLLRTFLFCPVGASMKNVTQVFSVWIAYLEPWRVGPKDFTEFEQPVLQKPGSSSRASPSNQRKDAEEKESSKSRAVYTSLWDEYVAANFLFYTSLVVHFLGFAHKFFHANADPVVHMVMQLLNILTSSRELICLLQSLDKAYHSKASGLYSSMSNVDKFVPSIRLQLKDWEGGLCESEIGGSFLLEKCNQDLKLFSNEEDGAHKLLQLFVIRTEHEIQVMPGDRTFHLRESLSSIKSQISVLFGNQINCSRNISSARGSYAIHHNREEVFTPKHPGIGRRTSSNVKYKGDWMRRPISDTEVAWLARFFIRLSDWLNDSLGLDRGSSIEPLEPNYLELTREFSGFVGGPKEAAGMVITLITSLIVLLGQSIIKFMRAHEIRVNLRVLASKKLVMVLLVYATVYMLKNASSIVYCHR
ncbi:hypothetical protein AXF42_Ash012580 [Apostasia shenzhenica]|uniref:Sphingomyelin phosphodiesterase 4 n=1 Tax=Apostasia shenzhenica TaxID=1088818 RepID=A0A2H9ZT39_9ASPA|nr:hypothetical protein AXF42_Ash012580 [Apostasia shenzhenica]